MRAIIVVLALVAVVALLAALNVGCCHRPEPRPFSYTHREDDGRGGMTVTVWQNLTLDELKAVREACGR